jgi:hypothetical protein
MESELNVFDEDIENPIIKPNTDPKFDTDIKSDFDKSDSEWSDDIEGVLNNILENCSLISEHHKKEYNELQNTLKYFKIPVITISAVNSVFSFALLAWLSQTSVTSVNCFLSLTCSIISSIELYLNISKRSDVELISYKKYYLLSIKINSILKLNSENRTPSPKLFLCEIINEYNTLFNESNVNGLGIQDKLLVFKTPIL